MHPTQLILGRMYFFKYELRYFLEFQYSLFIFRCLDNPLRSGAIFFAKIPVMLPGEDLYELK